MAGGSNAGIFIGIDRRTGQYMLHDGTEVKLARTVMRVLSAEKWNKDALVRVGCTPYDLHRPRKPEVVFQEKTGEKVENPVAYFYGQTSVHQAQRSGEIGAHQRMQKV